MDNNMVLWILVGIISLVIDIITSTFVFVWFAVGAIAAIIASLLGYSFTLQLVTFIFVSTLFIIVGYPLVKNTIKRTVTKTPTSEQGYIGREITIDEEVVDKATIKIDGIYWTVKNEGDLIKKGDKVKITGIEGNKLTIKKL
jgi:membrane protein implicated in regulation of membrane protease activity